MAINGRLVLFGAGLVGRRVLPSYLRNFDIVALADNDQAKHGSTLLGVPVIPAEKIKAVNFDYIVITSTANAQIYDQLLEMGFSPDVIKESSEIHGARFPWDAVLFFLLVVCLLSIFSFYLIF